MKEIDEKKLKKVAEEMACALPKKTVWGPLEKVVPKKQQDGFMYMGKSFYLYRSFGNREIIAPIHDYKHGITRKYLHLDESGTCYRNTGETKKMVGKLEKEYMVLEPCSCREALDVVYKDIEKFGATRETKYDEDYKENVHKALADAGYTVVGIEPGQITLQKKDIKLKEKVKK